MIECLYKGVALVHKIAPGFSPAFADASVSSIPQDGIDWVGGTTTDPPANEEKGEALTPL